LLQISALRSDCVSDLKENDPEIAQCYFEAWVRLMVFGVLKMPRTGFLPPQQFWAEIPPEYYDSIRHATAQGNVSDSNAFAMGGISGHAGLFASAPDVVKLVRALVWPSASNNGEAEVALPVPRHQAVSILGVNATTWKLFSVAWNLTQSSRALGWDTNNYAMDTYRGCGNLSSTTWYHTGYTGTQICGDPERGVVTILLTNRAYGNRNNLADIQRARQRFNNEVKVVVDDLRVRVEPRAKARAEMARNEKILLS